MRTRTSGRQCGATTLLMVLGLVLLATLASAYSSRAVLSDLLASQSLALAAQARLAAQSALASAQALLLQPAVLTTEANPFLLQPTPCPPDLGTARWQCGSLPLAADSSAIGWQLSVTLARDLIGAPHVWQLRARASSPSKGQASVRESVFMPVLANAPTTTPTAALILNGCASEAAGSAWQICPMSQNGQACTGAAIGPSVYSHFVPDTDHNGSIEASENEACMAFATTSLPGGGNLLSPSNPMNRTPCNRAAWRSAFGDITPAQLQAWSQAQEHQGLNTLSQPARSIYWIDSPSDWTQSLGSPQAPVLLVFSSLACALRCPSIATGVHIHGSVYADAGCDDEKMRGWQAGWVEGQVVVESGLPQASGVSRIWARSTARDAYILHWPDGIDTSQVQRVPGSQWSGTP